MFNIRGTQPGISTAAIADATAAEVSAEDVLWGKIEFFFPQENYAEAQHCLAELFHPPQGMLPDHISSQFEYLKALTFPAWADNIQCNREGINQFCILDVDSREALVATIDSQHYKLEWEGGAVTCRVGADISQAEDIIPGAMALENREYEDIWAAWINDAPPEETEGRYKAVDWMRECLRSRCIILDLNDLRLTALPERLPEHILFLAVINNRLTKLPDTLPGGLQQLNASRNRLTGITAAFPDSLRRLDVSHNRLTEISVPLPERMEDLRISHNRLSQLPSPLPARLQQLEAVDNRLTAVPGNLPPALEWVDVSDNLLTDLPETIFGNVGVITALHNPFTEQAKQRLQTILSAPDYRGAQINYSVIMPPVADENRSEYTGSLQQIDEAYETMWSDWEHDAPSGEEKSRREAVQRLRALKESGDGYLYFYGLDLTSLPPLPDGVTILDVGGNHLSELPDNLPASLEKLTANYNQLTRIPDRLPADLKILEVNYNNLTAMPEKLPDSLRKLEMSHNKLTALPEALPRGLEELNASQNKLTRLPENLSSGLRQLYVVGNNITALPAALPWALKELVVAHNKLTALSENLPHTLEILIANHNELTRLPERLPLRLKHLEARNNELIALPERLPPGLAYLDISYNHLSVLPERLPSGLREINARVNRLTALPETLPVALERLNVEANQLTTLPEYIIGSIQVTIEAEENPLSERTVQRLLELQESMSADGYAGSRVDFSMGGPSAPLAFQPLHQAVGNWLPFDQAERWKAFETAPNAEAFSGFLAYLSKTQNAKNPEFMAEVSALLMRLADDDALRKRAFAIAIEATERCEDRVTYTYHNIQCALQVYDIEKGDLDSRLPELITLGREIYRLEQIEQIAQEKVKKMHFVDPIEVFLGYQNRLRDVFKLTTVTREMRFLRVSGITGTDLQKAEERIKKAEDAGFRQWFTRWDPWHKVLERIVPEVWSDVQEQRADILETDEYKQRLSAVVTDLKDSGVQNAELAAQMEVFKEIEGRLLESVTEKVLADEGLAQLLNAQWGGHSEQ